MNIEEKSALIILNYNKYKLTIRIVKNLIDINYSGDIVIVDNNSKNDSFKILKDEFEGKNEKIHVIESDKNGGYAYGNNIGIKYITNIKTNLEYIGILNPDIILMKNFSIGALIEKISNRDDIVGITPVQIYKNRYSLRNIGWKSPKFINLLISNIVIIDKLLNFSRYSSLSVDKKDINLANIDVMPGCFFIIKKQHFEEVGYFDENTFLYYEENILAKKIRDKGNKFVVALDQYYIHDHDERNNDAKKLKYRISSYKQSFESQKYYAKKYLNIGIAKYILLKIASVIHLYIEIPMIHVIKKYI